MRGRCVLVASNNKRCLVEVGFDWFPFVVCIARAFAKFIFVWQQSPSNTFDVVAGQSWSGFLQTFVVQRIVSVDIGWICIYHLHLFHALFNAFQTISNQLVDGRLCVVV